MWCIIIVVHEIFYLLVSKFLIIHLFLSPFDTTQVKINEIEQKLEISFIGNLKSINANLERIANAQEKNKPGEEVNFVGKEIVNTLV